MESTPKKRGRPCKSKNYNKTGGDHNVNKKTKLKIQDNSLYSLPNELNETFNSTIKNISKDQQSHAVQLQNEIVPDDGSLTVKLNSSVKNEALLRNEVAPNDSSLTIKRELIENFNSTLPSENISKDQQSHAVQLLNEVVPVDGSLTVKLKKEIEDQKVPRFAQHLGGVSGEQVDMDESDGEKDTDDEEDKGDFEEVPLPYITRADMVLKMDNITKDEKEACYEVFEQELVKAAEKYNFKMPHDDPECLYDFFFFRLPTPPIQPELRKRKFSEEVGPIKEFTAYESFSAIWNDAVMEDIVRETNKNGKQFSKKSKWIDTNIDELYVYFAITLATGTADDLKKYWKNSPTDMFNLWQAMTYKRFMILNKFVSFTDWNMDVYSQPQAKLFKIKPIIHHLNKSFSSLYRIGQDIVVDEPSFMIKNIKGEYKFLKNKCNMQEFDVSDAKTGYVWKFDILAQHSKVTRGIPPTLILKLLDELQNKGYTVWSDNVLNRFLLARVLKELGFNSVGTIRMKDIIDESYTKLSEFKVGEIAGCTSGDLDFIAWRHKKLVYFVSSYHGKTTTEVDGKVMLTAFVDYKNNVEVLDRRDKILADYNGGAKCKSWSRRMFRRLLNISVYNALILHKHNIEHTADIYKEFRLNLILELLERHIHTGLPSSVKDEKAIIKRVILPDSYWKHFPEELGGVTGKTRQEMQNPCHLCEKRTHVWCPGCNVALCLSTCYRMYHSPYV